ncbi:MAG: TrmB family transcriptional regulator [Lachnospiraceae bacterium]
MDLTQLAEKIMAFGLTRQEAVVYLCLLQNGEMTGYEAAKLTGVSRSNAYNALAGLVDKGAAYTTEQTSVKYQPVEIDEFLLNKIRGLTDLSEEIRRNMPKGKSLEEGYLTITGDVNIQNKVKNLIRDAEQRIYLSMTWDSIQIFEQDIAEAVALGKKVVILTDEDMDQKGILSYRTQNKEYQVGVISDSKNVLTGEYGKKEDSTCLFSGQSNFVRVFKDSLSNEIKIIQMMKGDI